MNLEQTIVVPSKKKTKHTAVVLMRIFSRWFRCRFYAQL